MDKENTMTETKRFAPQIKIPATYLRGGTSKGVFFKLQDLPEAAQQPGAVRDAIFLRALGSPDPYGKQIDGMGNSGALHTAPPMAQPWCSKHCISPNSLIFRFP